MPGASSLDYKFTITPNGQPWYKLQGLVNGNIFFNCTRCSEKVGFISIQGMMDNATPAWDQQRDTLKYVMEELKMKLLDIKAKIITTCEPLSLQGSMMCKQESSGHSSASWEFGFDGQIALYLESQSRRWTVFHGEGRLLKETLASDRAMTDLLVRTSAGDYGEWLKHVLCPQDGVLSTAAAVSKATRKTPITAIIPVILACSVTVGILCVSLQSQVLRAELSGQ
ncbi:UL16-binding protein 2-like [Molossus molossus]|uniref:UL16-binding protein 2-like n=1 Tax=Molossus molossus TaxID=27622 RepID=UPI00174765B6|nr:UL16-binding protein 2-like [Molossus molossus]